MNVLNNIKKIAEEFPERIAYKINKEILTYQELERASSILASKIQDTAKTSKTPVIVYGHKSRYMLICFMACIKSGRAYCPVDSSVPNERVRKIIETVEPDIILSTENLTIEYQKGKIWKSEDIKEKCKVGKEIEEKYCIKPEDVFYIIFTSGSTGIPKGVQITEECLNNFLKWSTTLIGNSEEPLKFLNQAPFSFDLSVMDLYTALATGGTLIAVDKETQGNIVKMFEVFNKEDINIWVSTPSFANMCLADKQFNKNLLPKLQKFLFCGETLPNSTCKRLMERFEQSEVINTYGPTESTVAVTNVTITNDMIEKMPVLPIGKPKENVYIFIQNEKQENLPDGEKGEIVIVGDTVSIGYFKNIEKTNTAFGNYSIDGKNYRLYRTGDKGYFKEGLLYYCGRIDFQIKLHGYRIEIEDIESNILKCDDIKNAAIVPIYEQDEITVKYLQAYLVTNKKMENNLQNIVKIKEELKQYLPNYMIPKKIKFIDKMPVTTNCKIDRKALRGL